MGGKYLLKIIESCIENQNHKNFQIRSYIFFKKIVDEYIEVFERSQSLFVIFTKIYKILKNVLNTIYKFLNLLELLWNSATVNILVRGL